MTTDQTTARGLGYLSLGLGLSQLLAPRWFARTVGVEGRSDNATIVRLIGVRELLAGAGLLTSRNPKPWVWLRVGGDVMDLALLGRAAGGGRVEAGRVNGALAGAVAVTAMDVASGLGLGDGSNGNGTSHGNGRHAARATIADRVRDTVFGGKPVRKAITINLTAAELYAYWRRLENLPRFMRHLQEVRELDDRRSHWVATAPLGSVVEWDAEITNEIPDREIAWRSLPNSTVHHEGTVRFVPAPGDRGTEVHVELTYQPPAGPVGVAIAKLMGEEPEQQISEDLRRLKQVIETGSIVTSEATMGERRLRQRPAQPLEGQQRSAGTARMTTETAR
jgi:uncharacterized membrane protein